MTTTKHTTPEGEPMNHKDDERAVDEEAAAEYADQFYPREIDGYIVEKHSNFKEAFLAGAAYGREQERKFHEDDVVLAINEVLLTVGEVENKEIKQLRADLATAIEEVEKLKRDGE